MNNIIRLAYSKREEEVVWKDTELYEYKDFSKYKLVNRFCKWLVEKSPFLSRHQERITTFRHVTVDTNMIGELIVQQVALWQRAKGKYPKYIFLGGKQWDELTRSQLDGGPYSFWANINNLYVDGRRQEYKGMRVVVVPWLDGVLVMPEVDSW